MKKLVIVFLFLVSFVNLWSQSTSVSTSVSNNSYLSISVSNTDFEYNYTASFDKENTESVKEVIEEVLGVALDKNTRTAYWEGTGYSVQLRQGRVKIEMEKEATTKSFQLKIEDLADQISETLGSEETPEPPKTPQRS